MIDFYLDVDTDVRLSEIQKDGDWTPDDMLNDRSNKIAFIISEAITDANKLLRELRPTIFLMSFYRNVGLVLFFAILVTSGLIF